MQFQVRSVPPAQFAAWTAGVRSGGPVLDRPAYAALARQSQRDPPTAYRAVDPQLFQDIALQRLAPGPGPQPEAPAHAGREVSTGGGD
jgi:cytochrome o ubiquinol oxidase subunit 2